jgi:hypothetical protein
MEVNSIEDFIDLINEFEEDTSIRTLIHGDACQSEEGGLSNKDSYQEACDLFCERYLDHIKFNISNEEISSWLWDYAS